MLMIFHFPMCCDSWGREESDTTERLIWSDLMIIGKFYFSSLAENSPLVHFYDNKVILFQEEPMVTQWTRQKAQWLPQRGLSWPWTALTRLLIWLLIFSGISSISKKLLNSSWRARCQTRTQRVKVFRPLLIGVTAPSTCRNGLSFMCSLEFLFSH